MSGTIPPGAVGLLGLNREELESVCKLAGLRVREMPFGPGFLADSFGNMPEQEGRPAAASVLLGGTAALALLGQSGNAFLELATDNGLAALAEAAWIIFALQDMVRTNNESARRAFIKAARTSGVGVFPRMHERLVVLANQLDEMVRARADPDETFMFAVLQLPIYAPSLCPFRHRASTEMFAALNLHLSRRRSDQDAKARASKARRAFSERIRKADGEGLVKLAAMAHGLSQNKAKHLFDAQDKRTKRSVKPRTKRRPADK